MFPKLLGAGAASFALLGLLGLSVALRPASRVSTPADKAASSLARTLNNAAREAADSPRIGWAVTKATAAHHMMVIEVDAERLDDASGIAIQIVEPVRSSGYEEILIYVRQPGSRVPAVRRIQWTPRGGYVESTYMDR
jgi:hypothetical protein